RRRLQPAAGRRRAAQREPARELRSHARRRKPRRRRRLVPERRGGRERQRRGAAFDLGLHCVPRLDRGPGPRLAQHDVTRGRGLRRLSRRRPLGRSRQRPRPRAMNLNPFAVLSLITAGIAAVLLLHHLIVRPALTLATRLKLLLGLAVFPTLTAVSTTG